MKTLLKLPHCSSPCAQAGPAAGSAGQDLQFAAPSPPAQAGPAVGPAGQDLQSGALISSSNKSCCVQKRGLQIPSEQGLPAPAGFVIRRSCTTLSSQPRSGTSRTRFAIRRSYTTRSSRPRSGICGTRFAIRRSNKLQQQILLLCKNGDCKSP